MQIPSISIDVSTIIIVIGGGFIGLYVSEARRRELQVRLICMQFLKHTIRQIEYCHVPIDVLNEEIEWITKLLNTPQDIQLNLLSSSAEVAKKMIGSS